jgi:hypothetical protein
VRNQPQGKKSNATAVKLASIEFENVRTEQNHCQGEIKVKPRAVRGSAVLDGYT